MRGLARAGHEVFHASDLFADATPDEQLRDWADARGAWLLTRDKDYSESWHLRYKPRLVVLLRSYKQAQDAMLNHMLEILPVIEKYQNRGYTHLFFELEATGNWIYRSAPHPL